jgi:hypothetical protein
MPRAGACQPRRVRRAGTATIGPPLKLESGPPLPGRPGPSSGRNCSRLPRFPCGSVDGVPHHLLSFQCPRHRLLRLRRPKDTALSGRRRRPALAARLRHPVNVRPEHTTLASNPVFGQTLAKTPWVPLVSIACSWLARSIHERARGGRAGVAAGAGGMGPGEPFPSRATTTQRPRSGNGLTGDRYGVGGGQSDPSPRPPSWPPLAACVVRS